MSPEQNPAAPSLSLLAYCLLLLVEFKSCGFGRGFVAIGDQTLAAYNARKWDLTAEVLLILRQMNM